MFSQANSWVTCEAIFFFVRDSFKTPYGPYSVNLQIRYLDCEVSEVYPSTASKADILRLHHILDDLQDLQ